MKAKIIISSIIVLLALISLTAFKVRSRSQKEQIEQLQNAPDKYTIAWHVRLAKAKGERKVVLASPIFCGFRAENLDEALSQYGAVVAQPINHKTYIASTNELYKDNEIRTWYKFRILENLSAKPIPVCRNCGDPDSDREKLIPQEMLPVNENEILIEVYGGTVEIDDVTVTQNNRYNPNFLESNQYLLFLIADAPGKVVGIGMGELGIYMISSENRLIPFSKENKRIIQDITSLYSSSLDSLKTYIWNHPSTK